MFQLFSRKQKSADYFIGTAIFIFFGTITSVSTVWSLIDIALALLVVPHIAALVVFAYKRSSELLIASGTEKSSVEEIPSELLTAD